MNDVWTAKKSGEWPCSQLVVASYFRTIIIPYVSTHRIYITPLFSLIPPNLVTHLITMKMARWVTQAFINCIYTAPGMVIGLQLYYKYAIREIVDLLCHYRKYSGGSKNGMEVFLQDPQLMYAPSLFIVNIYSRTLLDLRIWNTRSRTGIVCLKWEFFLSPLTGC